jgi:hypothetical protein
MVLGDIRPVIDESNSGPISFENKSASVIVIASGMRSGSTELCGHIAQHRCVIGLNEYFSDGSNGNKLQSGRSSEFLGELPELFENRGQHAVESLQMVHERACAELDAKHTGNNEQTCENNCAVVLKLFPTHDHVLKSEIVDLIGQPRTVVVVLERDPADRECSLNWARSTNDWGIHPSANHTYNRDFCASTATDAFKEAHDSWFGFVRSTIKRSQRPSIEVPFSAWISPATSEVIVKTIWSLAAL